MSATFFLLFFVFFLEIWLCRLNTVSTRPKVTIEIDRTLIKSSTLPQKIVPSSWGPEPPPNMFFWAHRSPHPKRHLDWFSRFSTSRGCDQQTHTHRPRNTGSKVTIGRIFALHACDAALKWKQRRRKIVEGDDEWRATCVRVIRGFILCDPIQPNLSADWHNTT